MYFKKKNFGFFLGAIYPFFIISAGINPVNDEIVFWPSTETKKFNTYESDFFRFDYAPSFSVKKWHDIVYLEENKSKTIVWSIFEPNPTVRYRINDHVCFSHIKKEKPLCTQSLENPNFIKNLVIFPKHKTHYPKQLSTFQENGFLSKSQPDGFFRRGEVVALSAKIKYPEKDFSEYAERCFLDVPINHPYAGEICWAKTEGIIMGIDQNFYPESTINVWGMLKILGLTFEQEWPEPDWEKVPDSFMTKLHPAHIAAPLLVSAWELGVLKNPEDLSLWPNRALKQKEVVQIVADFTDWKDGKVIKAWNPQNYTPPISKIFYQQELSFLWEIKKSSKDKYRKFPRKIIIENYGDAIGVWLEDKKGFFISSGIIPLNEKEKVKEINAWYDFERWEGEIEFVFESGTTKIYRPNIKKAQFVPNKTKKEDIQTSIKFLERQHRSPKLITMPDHTRLPIWDIEMLPKNFEHFFTNSTRNTRYPASLKMTYPDGEKKQYAITLKARGNANRGYIKPSLTIESFHNFSENKKYHGDEFLEKNDEIKLRSFINEETSLHEKLFYQGAKGLGLPAPDFFESLVTINGIPFGLFQVTEPIKKDFFKRRKLPVDDYFYAQNINATFDTNLGYYDSDEKTISAYKPKGNEALLLDLITALNEDDPNLFEKVDTENVFNYATLIWIANAWDSLTHNYYLAWNKDLEKWQIFPWDADLAWENIPEDMTLEAFETFAKNKAGNHNILINYVFENLSKEEREILWEKFWEKWKKNIPIQEWTEEYRTNLGKYFQYDNKLWNGRFLERKESIFDTDVAILRLKRELKKIHRNIRGE